MKIVSKAELLKMPKGTLFAEWREGHLNPVGGLMIFYTRSEGIDDFMYRSFDSPLHDDTDELIEHYEDMTHRGESWPVDLGIGREGLYDPSMRYWVWEPDDIERLINMLRGGDDDRYDE